MKFARNLLCSLVFVCTAAICSVAQTPEKPAVLDGGAGPCSLEVTVLGPDVRPVYGADVKIHVTYGFGGFHKLDLEVGTNTEGKAKFTGLPSRVHRPPLEVDAAKDDLAGMITYDPASQCEAKQQITLEKTPPKGQ